MLFEYVKQQYTRNVMIQDEIQQKRKYIQTTYGDAAVKGRPSEKLPKNYLPRMEITKDAAVAAASGPTISEGAKGILGEILKADTWIRALNEITKKNTPVIPGSPFAETACCFSPITSPGKMLRESSLPSLPTHFQRKSGVSYESIVYTPMISRDLQRFNPTQSLDLGYRVFLQLCWKGPRIGLPHEFGYDAKCDWCDIKIPTKYLYPDVNSSGNPDIDEAILRSEIESQGVPITNESFQALLNASHIRTIFPVYTKRTVIPSSEIVNTIASIQPSPVENWSESIKQVQESIVNLPKDGSASRIELAHAFEPLRDAIDESVVLSSLGTQNNMILNSFLRESPQTIFEILRAYFLIPAKRLLNPNISDSSMYTTVDSYYDLASEHSESLKETLKNHTDYMVQLKQILFDENNVVKQSMENDYSILMKYTEQLTTYIKHGSEFRLTRLKYDESVPNLYIELFLKEMMRGIIFGPICTLLNTSSNFLKIFINTMLRKYSTEKLSYEPNTIRQILEEASEREKQRFIGDLDRMTTEERAIELTKKKLGVGRWAIGGSKLLFMYDKQQWEKNMEDNVRLYPSTAQPESSNDGYDVGVNHGDDD